LILLKTVTSEVRRLQGAEILHLATEFVLYLSILSLSSFSCSASAWREHWAAVRSRAVLELGSGIAVSEAIWWAWESSSLRRDD
jgi:hypothetical protein